MNEINITFDKKDMLWVVTYCDDIASIEIKSKNKDVAILRLSKFIEKIEGTCNI